MKHRKLCYLIAFVLIAALFSVCIAAEDNVVYLKAGAAGNGTSPESPFGEINNAFLALPEGGTIVVIGDYALSSSESYDSSVPGYTSPASGGEVTVTGAYGGTDFGGRLICGAGARYFATCDTVFDNITFYNDAKKSFVISGRFFSLTFGENCKMDNIEMHVVGGLEHTNASLTVPDDDYSKDTYINVYGGTIFELTGLGRNIGKGGLGIDYTGTSHITVAKNGVVNKMFGTYRWGNAAVNKGASHIILDGGRVTHFITGCGSETMAYNNDVTIVITKNADLSKYFTEVEAGLGSDGAFRGLNGGPLYNTAVNYGYSYLDISDAPDISEEWMNKYVNIDGFDAISGRSGESGDMDVVFLSESKSTSGSGESYKDSTRSITDAFKKLGSNGGTIVVCGPVTVSGSVLSNFPTHSGKVTITSFYDGNDYRKDGAKLNIKSDIFLGGETHFERITLQSAAGVEIYCQGNSLHIGSDVKTQYSQNPIAIWGGTDGARKGVTSANMKYFDYTIEIDSGTWFYVRGGSIRTGEGQPVGTIGNVSIIINGGVFTSTTTASNLNGIIAISGFDALEGDANIIINGGVINSSVMGIGRPGYNSTTTNNAYSNGNVNITINGGTFRTSTSVGAVHDKVASALNGDFNLTVSGGNFQNGFAGFDATGVLGNAFYSIAEGVNAPLVGFDKTVLVKDGESLAEAVKGLGSDGGVAVIAGKVLADNVTLSEYAKKLRITSVWNGVDYKANGAVLTVNGTFDLGGKTIIENINLDGSGTVNANGYDLHIGKDVKSEGSLSLDGGKGNKTHGITVDSGAFLNVCGGTTVSSEAVYVIVNGGEQAKVIGGANGNSGAAYVSVRGGTVVDARVSDGKLYQNGGIENRGGKVNVSTGSYKDYNVSGGDGNVIFVKDGGDGDGTTPLKPMGDIVAASEKLPGGGIIVICGKYTVETGKTLRNTGGTVNITSVYGGIDYRVTDGAEIELSKYISLSSDAIIDGIKIVSAANDTYISAEGNLLTVGKDVECEIFKGDRTEKYPALVAGSVNTITALKGDTNLTVHSGTWGVVSGGQYSFTSGLGKGRSVSGNITVDINGGTFTDDIFISGANNLSGDAVLNVYGGTLACSVFGTAGEEVSAAKNVTLNAYGGIFEGDIRAAQSNISKIGGSFKVNIYGADISRVSTLEGAEKIGGTSEINVAQNIDINANLSGEITYQNPIAGFADPSIVLHDGFYYYTYANGYKGGMGLWMAKAANLCDIGKVEPVLIWSQKLSGEAAEMTALWAPQLYFIEDRWYVYAAAQTSADTSTGADLRYPYVWVGQVDDPMGPYTYFGCMENVDKDAYTYLSPRIIKHGGKWYMFCSGFYSKSDTNPHTQRMRVCELESPTKMASKQIVISSPVYDYEKGIMEGPYPFYAPNGTLYMIFAAGHTRTDEYCTGIMRFNGSESDSLLDASLWEKFDKPLQFVNYDNFVYSPGAMVVTTSPDGSKFYGVYHAKEYHYSAYTMRRMHMQEIRFDENGVPVMDDAQPVSTVFTADINTMPIAKRILGFTKSGSLDAYSRFAKAREYDGRFTDVPEGQWYHVYVKTAYDFALANGTSAATFSPANKFAVSHAITAAVNIHKAYYGRSVRAALTGENWYDPYVEYAVQNGIISADMFIDYNANITRGEMAIVFANILPDAEYKSVRGGSNPDVSEDMECYDAVKKLYTAGIVGGDAGSGNYRPGDEIVRSEACVIFTRLAAKEYRAK